MLFRSIQVGQLIASTCFIAVLFAQVPIWAENAQRTREDLPDGVPQWVIDMIPKSWMIKVSIELVLAHLKCETNMDLLICPGFHVPSCRFRSCGLHYIDSSLYTQVSNFVWQCLG